MNCLDIQVKHTHRHIKRREGWREGGSGGVGVWGWGRCEGERLRESFKDFHNAKVPVGGACPPIS